MSEETALKSGTVRAVQIDAATMDAIVAGVTERLRSKEGSSHLPLGERVNSIDPFRK